MIVYPVSGTYWYRYDRVKWGRLIGFWVSFRLTVLADTTSDGRETKERPNLGGLDVLGRFRQAFENFGTFGCDVKFAV